VPNLDAYRQQLQHRSHEWTTVDRDQWGAIQGCTCGAFRRNPEDEPEMPETPRDA
jgi:hypothetical protein